MNRAFSALTLRTVSEDERIIEGVATTPRPDRGLDQVMPLGAVFKLPLPFLLDHDARAAVGEVEHAKVTAKGITFRARIKKIAQPGAAKDLVDNAWALISAGLRKNVSVGFRPLEQTRLENGGFRFDSWEWLELSACVIPMNADAVVTGLRSASSRAGVVKIGAPAKTVHVAKIGPPKADHVVRLTAGEVARGRILAESQAREDQEAAWRRRMGLRPAVRVVRITAEAKRRGEIEDAARAELSARQRERLNR